MFESLIIFRRYPSYFPYLDENLCKFHFQVKVQLHSLPIFIDFTLCIDMVEVCYKKLCQGNKRVYMQGNAIFCWHKKHNYVSIKYYNPQSHVWRTLFKLKHQKYQRLAHKYDIRYEFLSSRPKWKFKFLADGKIYPFNIR